MAETIPALYELQIDDKESKPNTLHEICVNFGNGDNNYAKLYEMQIWFDYTNPDSKNKIPLFNFAG